MPSLTTKYLRQGGVVYATIKMRNKNEYPVVIKADITNPLKSEWNNSASILWTFAIHYLASEGMTKTSDGERAILVYIFHGVYLCTRKVRGKEHQSEKPILHALHNSLTANRSRFIHGVELHFQQFYQLLDEHPEWEKFLDDMGDGEPPRMYLVAVEVAIRSYVFGPKAKLTMGVGNQKITRKFYADIYPWRKTECYVTGVRYRRGRTSYQRWQCFSWFDHNERNKLAETFVTRHLPLSNGEDHFGGEIKDPPAWTTSSHQPVTKRPRTRKTRVKVEPRAEVATAMKFDKRRGALVPYVDLS